MITNVLKRALISEKSFGAASASKFTFVVDKKATKEDVSAAVSELFNVSVLSVNIINIIGKVKRTRKGIGKRSDYKKAVVTLKKGDKIDLFEIDEQKETSNQKSKVQNQNDQSKIKNDTSETTVKVREKRTRPISK